MRRFTTLFAAAGGLCVCVSTATTSAWASLEPPPDDVEEAGQAPAQPPTSTPALPPPTPPPSLSPPAQPAVPLPGLPLPRKKITLVPPLTLPEVRRKDYDAAKPDRGALDWARAAATVVVIHYVFYQIDWLTGQDYIAITSKTLADNFRQGLWFDEDPLQTNFFGHPYNGSLYFAAARANGLNFWESTPFAFLGSLSWELFSENQPASVSDLLTTTFGGIFLGEIVHRVSSQILDDSKKGGQRVLRELAAAAINPARGLERLTTGKTWASGDPPIKVPFRLGLDLGIDQVRIRRDDDGKSGSFSPSFLAAIQARYGSLLPRTSSETLGPLEYFDLYAGANLLENSVTGMQLYDRGLLYGWSSPIGGVRADLRDQDNNVFGIFQSFDYQGTNVATFGGFGFGPGDVVVLRRGGVSKLDLGATLEWVPMIGITSINTGNSARQYNMGMGGSAGLFGSISLGRAGFVSFRTKNYLAGVVNGASGTEFAGYARLVYEIDLVPGLLGVGVAPTAVLRRSNYTSGPVFDLGQVSTQIYMTVHN